jgi:hypothetical protein
MAVTLAWVLHFASACLRMYGLELVCGLPGCLAWVAGLALCCMPRCMFVISASYRAFIALGCMPSFLLCTTHTINLNCHFHL